MNVKDKKEVLDTECLCSSYNSELSTFVSSLYSTVKVCPLEPTPHSPVCTLWD